MLKGREIGVKFCKFCIIPKERDRYYRYVSIHSKVHAPYRKIEMLKLPHVLFWVVQNFRPFSRPFRATIEKSYKNQFGVE